MLCYCTIYCKISLFLMEPTTRIELVTPSLPRKCSTTEPRGRFSWSGKRGSNPQPSAWKADALAIELFPHLFLKMVGRRGFEPLKPLATDLQSAPFVHLGTSPCIFSPLMKKSLTITFISYLFFFVPELISGYNIVLSAFFCNTYTTEQKFNSIKFFAPGIFFQ